MNYKGKSQLMLRSTEVRPIGRYERLLWDKLMSEHHYLGFHSLIGESIRYIAICQEQWLALLGWSAAALKCLPREQWIGWPSFLKYQRLAFIANNSRFLILPHISIPNLASRILALNLKRLSDDWQKVYGHPILLAETFVDPRYFQGTCYKAAGWTCLGLTKGFAKTSQHYRKHDQPKMFFVRELYPHARQKLKKPYLKIKTKQEVKSMQLSEKHAQDLIARLLQIPDPRMKRGIRHKKISLLAIAICAIMSNAKTITAIAEWAKRCPQNILRRLRCRYNPKTKEYVVPSQSTILRFLQKVDAAAIDQTLTNWLESFALPDEAVVVDGKTLKGARQSDGRKVHLLSAFLHNQGTVLAQCQVESSTNEITKVPALLDPLDLKDRVVTLDALHTQKETAQYLVKEKKADYLLIVKDNQKNLKKDIVDLNLVAFPPSAPNS